MPVCACARVMWTMWRVPRDVNADTDDNCTPLWIPEGEGAAVGVVVKPDGMLTLAGEDRYPTLAFLVKETKPEVAKGLDTDDLCVTRFAGLHCALSRTGSHFTRVWVCGCAVYGTGTRRRCCRVACAVSGAP